MSRLKDLLELPPVRTVVKFSDLEDGKLRESIKESFVLTGEVRENLSVIFTEISKNNGQGFFLQGSYGSGKSHFLSVLNLLFTDISSHSILSPAADLAERASEIYGRNFLVMTLSLVDYSSSESLEDIISSFLYMKLKDSPEDDFSGFKQYREDIISLVNARYGSPLKSFLKEKGISKEEALSGSFNLLEEFLEEIKVPYRFKYSRKDIFDRFSRLISSGGYGGAFFLIDELSEFLRSKPEARKFNEDIRFLQYLGEISSKSPLWIVAGLQERIEETGEISPYVFNKIKDRYPVRLLLTGKHIEDLIKGRIIKKKPDSTERLKVIYKNLKNSFSPWPVSEEYFISLYPVHPETVYFLDNLKFLFSQHRGVVDFIHYQIKGDERRGIKGILDEPDDTLLTPDLIFDHFKLRIKETVELNPYHDIVYRYYEQEMQNLFPDEEDAIIAFRIVKILILISILPIKKNYSVRAIAESLLKRITELDSGINYQYFHDILEKLYRNGSYIGVIKSKEKFEDSYFIDIEADLNLIIKRKTEYIINSFFPEDSRIYERTIAWLDDPALPLAHLKLNRLNRRTVTWQNTVREGLLVLTNFLKITPENIAKLEEDLSATESDFIFFIATPHLLEKQREYLCETLIPLIKRGRSDSFIFWLPAEAEDEEPLRTALAHMLLSEEVSYDRREKFLSIKETLSVLLEEDRKKVKDIFFNSYKSGEFVFVIDGDYPGEEEAFVFDRVIDSRVYFLLDRIYPGHIDISPFTPVLTRNKVKDLVEYFFRPGRLLREKDYGLKMAVEGFLVPLKTARKTPQGFELSVSPKRSEPVALFLSLMTEEKTGLGEIYLSMRKGQMGISRPQFELLTYSLIFGGLITPLSENRKMPLNQITGSNFEKISHVSPGQLIPFPLQKIIKDLPLLPQKFSREDFSYSLQQEIWKSLSLRKKEEEEELERVLLEINKVLYYEGLSDFEWNRIKEDIFSVKEVMEEIKTSYSSAEGMERLGLKLQETPCFKELYERVSGIKTFFLEHLDRYLFIYHYVNYPDFEIPAGEKYAGLLREKDLLTKELAERDRIFTSDYMKNLEEKYSRFLALYQSLYQGEHRAVLSEEKFKLFEQIRDGENYRWLRKLSQISFISVKNDRVKADRYIAKALEKRCRTFDPGILRRKPFCNCNFRLGQKLELPSLKDIEEVLVRGIKEYLGALREERYRELLFSTIKGLEEIGDRRTASFLRNLLEIDLEGNSLISALKEYLTPAVIEAVNESLSGRVLFVTRNIDDLYDNLLDRSFPGDKLLEIFQEWIDGGERLNPKVYVKVISRSNPSREMPLGKEVNEKYPELLPLYQERGEEDFNFLLWTVKWIDIHSAERALTGKIFDIKEEDINRDYETLCELASYLFSEKKDLSLSLIKEVEGRIMDEKLEMEFWQAIYDGSRENKLSILISIARKEEFFSFVIHRAYSLILKILQDRPELVKNQEVQDFYNFQKQESRGISKDYARTFKIFYSLHKSLDGQNRWPPDGIKGYLQWEKVFTSYLAYEPCWINSLHKTQDTSSLPEEGACNNLKNKLWEKIKEYEEAFRDFYHKNYPRWKEGEKPRPYFIHDIIQEILPNYRKTLKAEHCELFLLDAMRWDLWGYIKKKIFSSLPQLRIVKEIPLWAHPPSLTHIQMEAFNSSSWPAEASLEVSLTDDFSEKEDFSGEKTEEKIIFDREKFVKSNLIDNKIHTSIDDIVTLYQEIILQLEPCLLLYFENLPAKSMVILWGDHGFQENLRFSGKKGRYFHGGISLWEIMAPLVIIFKP